MRDLLEEYWTDVYSSGGQVLRNASLASRLDVLVCVLSSATFLKFWFLIFSPRLEPFFACMFLISACMYRSNRFSRTSDKTESTSRTC